MLIWFESSLCSNKFLPLSRCERRRSDAISAPLEGRLGKAGLGVPLPEPGRGGGVRFSVEDVTEAGELFAGCRGGGLLTAGEGRGGGDFIEAFAVDVAGLGLGGTLAPVLVFSSVSAIAGEGLGGGKREAGVAGLAPSSELGVAFGRGGGGLCFGVSADSTASALLNVAAGRGGGVLPVAGAGRGGGTLGEDSTCSVSSFMINRPLV